MIKIQEKSLDLLKSELKEQTKDIQEENKQIPSKYRSSLYNILSDKDFKHLCLDISNPSFLNSLDYETLCNISDILKSTQENIESIRTELDIKIFLKDGYKLDIKGMKAIFKRQKLKKKFPNIILKRLGELYEKPPETLKPNYETDDYIMVDPFVFRKFILAIIQMIFNEMDLLICYVGSEGNGKSTKASQDMYMTYYILKECGIVDYKFNIKETFFNTLQKLREKEDEYFSTKFKIFGLDEGNELNKQNWKDEEVSTFFQRLRRERFNQRIKFICMPVLGELLTNIVLARVNFIFETKSRNKVKTGTLQKGIVNFYIIPRGDKIYSPAQKREISKDEIKKKLFENLKDKSYLTGMPKDILIKEFRSNGTWGFEKKEYVKHLKESNETFTVNKGISLGEMEAFMLYKANITLKKLKIKSKDIRYASVAKIFSRINGYFDKNIDLKNKYQSYYDRKLEEKGQVEEEE